MEQAIRNDLSKNGRSIKVNTTETRSVVVNETKLDYAAHRLPDGTFNVGRITPPKQGK